jgi:hypothetical protein
MVIMLILRATENKIKSSSLSSASLLVAIRATFLAFLLFQDEAAAENSQYNYGAKNGESYLETFANFSPGKTVDGSSTSAVDGAKKKQQETSLSPSMVVDDKNDKYFDAFFNAYHTYFIDADKSHARVLLRRKKATPAIIPMVEREEESVEEKFRPPNGLRQCIREVLEEEEAASNNGASNNGSRKPKKKIPNRRKKKDAVMIVRKLQDNGDYDDDVEGSMSEDTVSETGNFVDLYKDLGNIFNEFENEETIEYDLEEDDGDGDDDDGYHLEEEDTGYYPTIYDGENKLDDEDTERSTERPDELQIKVRHTIQLC